MRDEKGAFLGISGKPEYVKSACDARMQRFPRFEGANIEQNLRLVDKLKAIAEAKKATAGQVALAWLLAQGDDIAPIPGTKRRKYLEENCAATELKLTAEDLVQLSNLGPAAGGRYADLRSIDT
jgi:aryl-alcohol dehydrogenase-like predicted oxidoreductase